MRPQRQPAIFSYQQFIKEVITGLREPEDRRLAKIIVQINAANQQATGTNGMGFLYNGDYYIPSTATNVQIDAKKVNLHLSLCDEMKSYLADAKIIKDDMAEIHQVLFKLLYQASNLQEQRDALPECVVPLVPEFAKMPRHIQNPEYLIRSDERALRQYRKALPKIELYAATRLIY